MTEQEAREEALRAILGMMEASFTDAKDRGVPDGGISVYLLIAYLAREICDDESVKQLGAALNILIKKGVLTEREEMDPTCGFMTPCVKLSEMALLLM